MPGIPLHPATRRNPVLDGLRALAIGMVIAFHVGLAPGGGSGVTVFFVLSGFLITGLLTKPRALTRRGVTTFYVRRFLRLFPALAAVCGVALIWALAVLRGDEREYLLTQVLTSTTYTQDFYLGRGAEIDFGYLGHTWSLAVEEQFYLAWPVVLLGIVTLTRRVRIRLVLIAALVLVIAGWRAYLGSQGKHAHAGVGIDAQADSLLIGCMLALAMPWLRPTLPRHPRLLDVAAAAALTMLVAFTLIDVNSHTPGRIGYVMVAVATAVLICRLLVPSEHTIGRTVTAVFSWRPVVFVGLISYSLYLWHFVLLMIAKHDLGIDRSLEKAAVTPVLLVVLFVVAYASYRWIETPFQLMKDRVAPEPSVTIHPPKSSDVVASTRAPVRL